jgi:hypothetical protein
MIAMVTVCCEPALAKETLPDQTTPPVNNQPFGDPKAVTTTVIKRCRDGYELVTRANGRAGCAKDILPPND